MLHLINIAQVGIIACLEVPSLYTSCTQVDSEACIKQPIFRNQAEVMQVITRSRLPVRPITPLMVFRRTFCVANVEDADMTVTKPKPVDVTFQDVSTAAYRIRKHVERTKIHLSKKMSKLLGMNVYFKNEFELPTGRYAHLMFAIDSSCFCSFKERGACNAIKLLSPEQRKKGVIAASAGTNTRFSHIFLT